jgi:transposase
MTRFVQGTDRTQSILFPASLDEYVAEDNPARVIEAFVDTLDLALLGFEGTTPAHTGRPSYHPSVLLKIYIYGYLNRVQSSRRLESETRRNIEMMWLTGHLMPDFKTIADFRKENGEAIRQTCQQFVLLCQRLDMLEGGEVAIDGSKFKAVNNRDKNFTDRKLQARIEQVEESIARYLEELDRADRQPTLVSKGRVEHIKEKIASLQRQVEGFNELGKQLQETPDQQISLTDPDARSMATSGRGTGMVGYNVQTAVDTTHHLIVAHEVTNEGHDRAQLTAMGVRARDAVGQENLTVLADRGYYNSPEIMASEQLGLSPLVPKPLTSGNRVQGQFDKQDFVYLPKSDEYRCPANQRAIWCFSRVESGLQVYRYWYSACPQCLIKAQCTTGKYRRISRWEHEDLLERMQSNLPNERTWRLCGAGRLNIRLTH